MKAAIFTKYGPPEVVSVIDVEKPAPKDNEVLVKVKATTVNRTDCGFRSAEYFVSRFFSGLFRPKIPTLGNEFSGIIESVGKKVTAFKQGDCVFGYNDTRFGGHAEFMIMKENEPMATLPADYSCEQAAPLLEGAHYALMYMRACKVGKGTTMLINGATGSIGSAGVQLAKYLGASVTAVCGSKNIGLVKSLGADEVIDYTSQDFTQLEKKFDVVFDSVGKSSFSKCRNILKERGLYTSSELGKRGDNVFRALIPKAFVKKRVLFPIPTINKEDVLFIKDLAERGKFKPVIDRTYTLDQIVEAYRYVETGQKIGNVVIKVGP